MLKLIVMKVIEGLAIVFSLLLGCFKAGVPMLGYQLDGLLSCLQLLTFAPKKSPVEKIYL